MADCLRHGNHFVDLQIHLTKNISEFEKALAKGSPDFVLLRETADLSSSQVLTELRKSKPTMPAILVCEAVSEAWETRINDQATEVLSNPVSIQELDYRIAKLLQNTTEPEKHPYQTRVMVKSIAEMRNKQSGRLDAKRTASVFGMTLADVARSIGKSLQAVHRTPDSKSLQSALFPYERIASAITQISSADNALKIWLNTPNDAFPGKLPVELITEGRAGLLADLLEDVLLGHPD
jgi:response regulator RpfG family c-di-GMP phosphodiesterase